jgi:microcystin-dependent protein
MEFHEINSVGPIKVERCTTATFPTTGYYEGRIIFDTTADKLYYGTGVAWVEMNDASLLTTHTRATTAHGTTGKILGEEHKTDPSGHPLATSASNGFLRQLPNDVNKYMDGLGQWSTVTIPAGDGTKKTITQANTFTVGDIVRLDGSTYVKACADSSTNAEVVGVVSSVSAGAFDLTLSGYVSASAWNPLTAGTVYFLSDATSGSLTSTEPTASNHVSKPILLATSTTEGYFVNWRGFIVPESEEELPLVPVGSIITWTTSAAPSGFLECDGSLLSRTTYSELFYVIGTTYGTTSASNFRLPDYRGYFLRGWDNSRGIDSDSATRTNRGDGTVGDHVGTKQSDAFKAHYHLVIEGEAAPTAGGHYTSGDDMTDIIHTKSQSSVVGNQYETRPKNIYVMYCIKY